MAKAKKLPSGNWRVNQFIGRDENGKQKFQSFTAPTKKEAEYLAAEYVLHQKKQPENITVGESIDKYIASKDNILSPTTISGYRKIRRNNMAHIMDIPLKNMTSIIVQSEINRESANLSPKSIRNAYGLLNSALSVYAPDLILKITFPAKSKKNKELLKPDEIMRLIKDTNIELPVTLALWLGLRMSEILGIRHCDIKDGYLTINRVKVYVDGQYIIKEQAKTFESNRRLHLPEHIQKLIDKYAKDDYIITDSGQAIYKRFTRLLETSAMPHMRFHDLRHLNASVMVALGVPNIYAMERGGWKTDDILKSVYQHTFSDERKDIDEKIDVFFQSCLHESLHEK